MMPPSTQRTIFPGYRVCIKSKLFLNGIIAVAGDTIEIMEGKVFINGMLKEEDYVRTANVTKQESREMHSVVVPMNGYFVMGDNRDKSLGDNFQVITTSKGTRHDCITSCPG